MDLQADFESRMGSVEGITFQQTARLKHLLYNVMLITPSFVYENLQNIKMLKNHFSCIFHEMMSTLVLHAETS